jgi:hypothetical protein
MNHTEARQLGTLAMDIATASSNPFSTIGVRPPPAPLPYALHVFVRAHLSTCAASASVFLVGCMRPRCAAAPRIAHAGGTRVCTVSIERHAATLVATCQLARHEELCTTLGSSGWHAPAAYGRIRSAPHVHLVGMHLCWCTRSHISPLLMVMTHETVVQLEECMLQCPLRVQLLVVRRLQPPLVHWQLRCLLLFPSPFSPFSGHQAVAS